jgi:hypothetical protein
LLSVKHGDDVEERRVSQHHPYMEPIYKVVCGVQLCT